MQITTIGYILLPLGLILSALYPRSIYILTIFFIPFTATSLLNSSSNVPLTPGQYFGGLFISLQLIFYITRGEVRFPHYVGIQISLIYLFLAAVLFSALYSAAMSQGVYIGPHSYTSGQVVKSTLPVLFGIVLLTFIVLKNNTIEIIERTLKVYIISGLFVTVWGYIQFICNNVLGIEYPWYIFNNAVPETMHGYKQEVEVEGIFLPRISSVFHEPSMFSKYLLTVLPLLIVSILRHSPILGYLKDRIAFCLIVGVLLLSTSTTAYIGLAILFIFSIVLMIDMKKTKSCYIIAYLLFTALVVVITYFCLPMADAVIKSLVLEKLSSGSGVERLASIKEAWGLFLTAPVLGVGWNTVTSNDLLVNLLANTGLLGALSFSCALVVILYNSKIAQLYTRKVKGIELYKLNSYGVGIFCSLLTLVTIGMITGIEFYLEYLYFILAMAISLTSISRSYSNNKYRCSSIGY